MKYVVQPVKQSTIGYCYTCDKCGTKCKGLYECCECPPQSPYVVV